MSVDLQPSRLLADHIEVERRGDLTLFKFTDAAQERLQELLDRHKELGLTSDEQAELDRIFTYINAQLTQASGHSSAP